MRLQKCNNSEPTKSDKALIFCYALYKFLMQWTDIIIILHKIIEGIESVIFHITRKDLQNAASFLFVCFFLFVLSEHAR